ncbi:unnamed protein product, partial [Didymodactylos carnosus]
MHVLQT